MNNEAPAAKASAIPDAALAAFAATILVLMISFPITRDWMGDQFGAVFTFLWNTVGTVGQTIATVWNAIGGLF